MSVLHPSSRPCVSNFWLQSYPPPIQARYLVTRHLLLLHSAGYTCVDVMIVCLVRQTQQKGKRMKRTWTSEELLEHFTLLPDELAAVGNQSGATRLGFAVLLKCLQYEGCFPRRGKRWPQRWCAFSRLRLECFSLLKTCVEKDDSSLVACSDTYPHIGSTGRFLCLPLIPVHLLLEPRIERKE